MNQQLDDIKSKADTKSRDLKLKIDAHVIKQLGAELITSPLTAITEFVKNSHDAGASWCKVNIDPDYEEVIEVEQHLYPINELIEQNKKFYRRFIGKITITDDGCGMTRETINKSWLTVSFSEKRRKKALGEQLEILKEDRKSKNKVVIKRNYAGDKGLGRLGSMQIASICRITTATIDAKHKEQVTINWDQIQEGTTIDLIQINESTLNKPSSAYKGSQIDLVGLIDLNYWKRDLSNFKYHLAVSVSPFSFFERKGDSFNIYTTINGNEENTSDLVKNIFNKNASWYQIGFDGQKLTVQGKSILMAFESQNIREDFSRYISTNNGKELLKYFQSRKDINSYNVKQCVDNKYFLEWSTEIHLESIVVDRDISDKTTNPGRFSSEIYDFIYNKNIINNSDGLGFKDSKDLIKDYLSGITLYRDGFKIGSGREDWLRFGWNKTEADGAYALRRANTSGYVDISSNSNPQLIDSSNREGLIHNDVYEIFLSICSHALDEIDKFRNRTRRATLEFISEQKNADAEKPKQYSPQQAVIDLKIITKEAERVCSDLKEQKKKTDKQFSQSSLTLEEKIKKTHNLFTDPAQIDVLNQFKAELDNLKELYQSLELKVLASAQKLAVSERSVAAIEKQTEEYDAQITRFYGHVAIGLSAQFLAHDVNAQVSNISYQSKSLKDRLKTLDIKDLALTQSLMSIDGHTQALSKVTAALDPLMQAQKEEKHNIILHDELTKYIDFIKPQLAEDNINIVFNYTGLSNIKFNKGKFFQVIDNIIRNSQFWLNNLSKHTLVEPKEIHIELSETQVSIWDTGRGFRAGIEPSMFEMFVSDKPNGQGLGLFIVKALLKNRNCFIYVSDEKNIYGNKYKLQLDYSGAL